MLDLSRRERFGPWTRLRYHLGAWLEGALWGLGYPLWMAGRPAHRRRHLECLRLAGFPLPDLPLDRLVPADLDEELELRLKSLAGRAGNTTVTELFALALMAALLRPRRVLEIGTYDGRSARAIATQLAPDARLYTLNLPPDHLARHPEQAAGVDAALAARVTSGERFLNTPEAQRIVQWFGDSRAFELDRAAPYQMIFIDGGHSYEVVASDSRRALEVVDRDGGAILWHDATRFGVRRLLRELHRRLPLYRIAGTDLALLRFRGGGPLELE